MDEGKRPTCNKDCKDATIQGLVEFTKKNKEKLITAANKSNKKRNNVKTNRKTTIKNLEKTYAHTHTHTHTHTYIVALKMFKE